MFEEDQSVTLDQSGPAQAPKKADRGLDWSHYTVAELVEFMGQIRKALPPLQLSQVDLEEEMLLQLHVLRELQASVIQDEKVAVNQRVQTANAVANVLGSLMDRQGEVYTQERYKAVEMLLIRTLTKLPEEQAKEFIEGYELALHATKK